MALSRGATEILIIGGLSGRLDHTLSNLAILAHLNEKKIPATMTDGQNRARFVRNSGALIPRG
jgi:thiamine pyrophosphokinase